MSKRDGPSAAEHSGVLVIDKPSGVSSFDVIRRLRRILGKQKFGHAGTLDPMATGVLVILIGRATRLSAYLMDGRKRYRADIRLGVVTDSDDMDGEVIAHAPWEHLDPVEVEAALAGFVGSISQVPPKVSAIKQDGKRAYARVRAGEEVELPARDVMVYGMADVEVCLPQVRCVIDCGKGTYIRSIARDLGERLGTGGTLAALRRERVGPFTTEHAVTLEELEAMGAEACWASLVPSFDALAPMPVVEVSGDEAVALLHGRTQGLVFPEVGTYRVAMPGTHTLLALLEHHASGKTAAKIFAAAGDPA